jgi:hypothetical protein
MFTKEYLEEIEYLIEKILFLKYHCIPNSVEGIEAAEMILGY